jgi:hypothetical protein
MAADRNLRRSLLDFCRSASSYTASDYAGHHDTHQYPLPSPPTSLYQHTPSFLSHSPPPRKRASSSSSHSSEETPRSPHMRKRRRSRSPSRKEYRDYRECHSRASYDHRAAAQSDASSYPLSPRSSQSSSQHTAESPYSRETMTIGSLISARGAEYDDLDRRAASPAS